MLYYLHIILYDSEAEPPDAPPKEVFSFSRREKGEGRREGVVGAVPPTAGIVTLTALRAHRYSEAASTSEYGMGVFSKEVFSINTGRI
jgi:hypothetical protein